VKVSFISLGCAKNLVNTEQMMALCRDAGMELLSEPDGADAVVINTCGFIDSAKSEAIDTILSAAALKEAGRVKKILVTGCLSQRYREEILTELPEVDGILGTGSYGEIVQALRSVMAGIPPAASAASTLRWRSWTGCWPRPGITPICASPRAATTTAPTA
jgi:ribosomal protein S12 methylthiotransferase